MSKKRLSARLVEGDRVDEWDGLAASYGCLFDTTRWTHLFEPGIRRIGIFDTGGNLRGGLCVWEQRKCGLRIYRNPPFTPHIGPFFENRATNATARTDEERAVAEAMADYFDRSGAAVVSLSLSAAHTDCLPFFWRNFKVVPYLTFRISLQASSDELMERMSVDRRNDIRKALRDGIQVAAARTVDVSTLVAKSLSRNGRRAPTKEVTEIMRTFPPGQGGYGFVALRKESALAVAYIVHDTRTAYYLFGGYTDGGHHGAGALAMWHAILKAKELGLQVFDFEGSVVPAIERYFRAFGGRLTPYFGVHKAWLPLEMLLKLKFRNRF